MALVRKYQKAGKVEEPKKVLTYENVGTYDAEKLAASLTQSLESYANSLGLQAKDRQDFLKFGALMVTAIKDGNVTKNTDGSYSIKGQYGLNNDFSKLDIAQKQANGEVGYGAQQYMGDYQQSYGIFTTKDTEDFRHRNHILGLVGQWVNSALSTATTLESKKQSTSTEDSTPFSFDTYFKNKEFGGVSKNKSLWEELYPTEDERFDRIKQVLGSLTDEDFNKWAEANPNLGTGEQLKASVRELINSIETKNFLDAKKQGLKLGISLNSYLPAIKDPDPADGEIDPYYDMAKKYFEDNHAIPSEDDILQLADILRKKNENEVQRALNNTRKENVDVEWQAEVKNLEQAFMEYETPSTETVFDGAEEEDAERIKLGLENSLKYLNSVLRLYNTSKPIDKAQLAQQVDAFVDAYNSNFWSTPYKNFIYQPLTKGTYAGWVLIKPSSTVDSSIIFNPRTFKFRIVHNTQLEESEYYKQLHDLFYRTKGVILKHGGVIPMLQEGNSVSFLPSYLQQEEPMAKIVKEAKDKQAQQEKAKQDQEKSGRSPFYNSKVEDEDGDLGNFELHDEDVLRLIGVLGDAVSLFGGLADVGGSGLSLLTNTWADAVDDDIKGAWPVVKNALINTGLSVAGFIPTLGSIKLGRNLQRIAKIAPKIITSVLLWGGISDADVYLEAFNNLRNGRVDTQDLERLLQLTELTISFATAKGKYFNRVGGVRQRKRSNQVEFYEKQIDPDLPYTVENPNHPFKISQKERELIGTSTDRHGILQDIQKQHGVKEADLVDNPDIRRDYRESELYKEPVYGLDADGNPIRVKAPRAASFLNNRGSIASWLNKKYAKLAKYTQPKYVKTGKPVAGQKVETEQQGGVLEFARNFAQQFKNGGFLIPKGKVGFKIGDQYFDTREGAEWYKQQNNLTDNIEDNSEYEFDAWNYKKLFEDWLAAHKQGMFTPGRRDGTIPSNASQKQMAIDMQNEDIYKEFTTYIRDAIASNKLNPSQKAYLESLQKYVLGQNPKGAAVYFDANGNLNTAKAGYYERMRTDDERGWHHFTPEKRDLTAQKVYLNGTEVTDEAKKTELLKNDPLRKFTQENGEGVTTHLFYEDGDPSKKNPGDNPDNPDDISELERLIAAGQNGQPEDQYRSRINTAYFNEGLAMLGLNIQNARATEQDMDYIVPQEGYIHTPGLLEHDQQGIWQAHENSHALQSKAQQLKTTDADALRAADLQATAYGLQGVQNAQAQDSNRQFQSRLTIQNNLNRDNQYNLQASNRNYANVAAKTKADAEAKARLTIKNAENVRQFAGLISSALHERESDLREFFKERELKRQGFKQYLELSKLEAKKKSLIPGTDGYEKALNDYYNEVERVVNELNYPYPMRDILGRRIILSTDVERKRKSAMSRKGSKLTATDHYILQGAKDYNKLKLQNAREFYKNARQRKRKS